MTGSKIYTDRRVAMEASRLNIDGSCMQILQLSLSLPHGTRHTAFNKKETAA